MLIRATFSILIVTILISLAISLAVSSCTKDKTPRPIAAEPCDANKVYFSNSIKPLLISNCAKGGCHDAVTQKEELNFTTYEGVMKVVRPGRPDDSELIERINEDKDEEVMPPPPNAPLTAAQKDLLYKWIQQGADNATCEQDTGNCISTSMSFSGDIQPILNTNCIGCHSGTTIEKGVDLSNYAGVQSVAQSGRLYNAISQNGQATPMPPGTKLPVCDIRKIKAWIDEGIRNN